jgi:hypothetical protein
MIRGFRPNSKFFDHNFVHVNIYVVSISQKFQAIGDKENFAILRLSLLDGVDSGIIELVKDLAGINHRYNACSD